MKDGLPWLKKETVIPDEFFKIVVDETPPRKAVAFLYSQKDAKKGSLAKHVVLPSVAQEKSGLNFEDEIEGASPLFKDAKTNLDDWNVFPEKKNCPQKKEQVPASELLKKRKAG